jgi:AcrR family transcriptional regulator
MAKSPSVARRARERQQLRARILDAARELFAAEGYDAVTIRRVAEKIEYTPPVIYQHFADKATLIREICYTDFREFGSQFRELLGLEDPIDRLRRMGELYVEFGLTHPNHYRLMFMTPPPADGPLDHRTIDPEARGNPELDAYAMLRMNVDAALQAGRFNPDLTDPALVAHVLWQSVHGIVSMHIARGHDQWIEYRDPRETARLAIRALMHGLTCDARS